MTPTVDLSHAAEILERLAPALAYHEGALRAAAPAGHEDDTRDAALRASLSQLGLEVSRPMYAYLRWQLERTRRTDESARQRSTSVERARREADANAHVEAAALGVPRLMCDGAGARWVVSEPRRPTGSGAPECLLFVGAQHERRRQPSYPRDWRALSNDALSALLPPA
jgi:hypothetical protein